MSKCELNFNINALFHILISDWHYPEITVQPQVGEFAIRYGSRDDMEIVLFDSIYFYYKNFLYKNMNILINNTVGSE